jgi:hypothetical protein
LPNSVSVPAGYKSPQKTTTNIYDNNNEEVQAAPTYFATTTELIQVNTRRQFRSFAVSAIICSNQQKPSDPSLNDNSDTYDVTDCSGFTVATKVTPWPTDACRYICMLKQINRRCPYDDEIIVVESCYDDEVMVVAEPIATA